MSSWNRSKVVSKFTKCFRFLSGRCSSISSCLKDLQASMIILTVRLIFDMNPFQRNCSFCLAVQPFVSYDCNRSAVKSQTIRTKQRQCEWEKRKNLLLILPLIVFEKERINNLPILVFGECGAEESTKENWNAKTSNHSAGLEGAVAADAFLVFRNISSPWFSSRSWFGRWNAHNWERWWNFFCLRLSEFEPCGERKDYCNILKHSTKLNHKQSERCKLRDFLQSCLTKKQQKGAGLPNLPIVVFHWKETLLMILSSCFRTSYRHDFSLLILSFLCVCVIWGFVENRRLIAYSQTRHEIHQQSDRCKARWLCDCKKSSFKKATF